jgi:hypothetical protein
VAITSLYCDAGRHHHGFGGGGGPVVHGGIRHFHAGEAGHLGLELEQHLQRALAHLSLIGRVGRQELRSLDEVVHCGGDVVAVSAGTHEERPLSGRAVPPGHCRERALNRHLGPPLRQVHQPLDEAALGNVGEEVVNPRCADALEHQRPVVVGQRVVSHGSCPFTRSRTQQR